LHRTLDLSSLLLPIQAHPDRWGDLEGSAEAVRDYRNAFVHRRREKGTESWETPKAISTFLDAAIGLVSGLGSNDRAGELREIETSIRSVLAGIPLPTRAERDRIIAAIAGHSPPTMAHPAPLDRTERFQFSAEQRKAVEAIVGWLEAQVRSRFVLRGPAGSGKTSIIAEVLEQAGLLPEEVRILAPTSKAKECLRRRLPRRFSDRCQTLTSFLWRHRPVEPVGEDSKFELQPKAIEIGLRLVVVDEASMLTDRDIERLHPYTVLFVGDPDQLPPVIDEVRRQDGEQDARILDHPDFELSRVHRHVPHSGIWETAVRMREGKEVGLFDLHERGVRVLDRSARDLSSREIDQLLCDHEVIVTGRNATRIRLNMRKRQLLGFCYHPGDYIPKRGEWLVVDENFTPAPGGIGIRLENGERIEVIDFLGLESVRDDDPSILEVRALVRVEGRPTETRGEVLLSGQMLRGLHLKGKTRDTFDISGRRRGVVRADWGYAITVHKAQGSEWRRVLVVEDLDGLDERIPLQRWRYTACTRAIEALTIVRLA
jgi:exodeoxyribonuclease-5